VSSSTELRLHGMSIIWVPVLACKAFYSTCDSQW